MTPVVEKLGLRRRRLGRRAPRAAGLHPPAPARPPRARPSPSSRPRPSSSSGCAPHGLTPRRLPGRHRAGLRGRLRRTGRRPARRHRRAAAARPEGRPLRVHPRGHVPRLRARRAHDRRARRRSSPWPRWTGCPAPCAAVFQPAEETIPGGAIEVVASGVLDGASRAFALHCDPSVPAGTVGLRTGAITAACDRVDITLTGPGGHTARPQLTVDLVDALGRLITDLPGLLSRQVDPRSGMSLVWGAVNAGIAANAIPQRGALRGTVRVLDRELWKDAEDLMRSLVERVVATTGAELRRRLRPRPAAGGQRPARGRPDARRRAGDRGPRPRGRCRRRAWAARTSAGSPR